MLEIIVTQSSYGLFREDLSLVGELLERRTYSGDVWTTEMEAAWQYASGSRADVTVLLNGWPARPQSVGLTPVLLDADLRRGVRSWSVRPLPENLPGAAAI